MNSPGRPSRANPVKPIRVGGTISSHDACGRTGRRKIFQRIARKNISDINKTNRMGDVPGPDLLGLFPESSPVETSPMTELQINQYTENDQNSAGYQNAFSIHVSGDDPS